MVGCSCLDGNVSVSWTPFFFVAGISRGGSSEYAGVMGLVWHSDGFSAVMFMRKKGLLLWVIVMRGLWGVYVEGELWIRFDGRRMWEVWIEFAGWNLFFGYLIRGFGGAACDCYSVSVRRFLADHKLVLRLCASLVRCVFLAEWLWCEPC